jgi:hypothetical protein
MGPRRMQERARKQLAEREQLAIEHKRPRKTYEQLQAELAEVGILIGDQPKKPVDIGAFRAKYGISLEQWNALPDVKT